MSGTGLTVLLGVEPIPGRRLEEDEGGEVIPEDKGVELFPGFS